MPPAAGSVVAASARRTTAAVRAGSAPLQLSLRDCLPAVCLLAAAVTSAMLVVQSTHECRQLHAALQQLEAQRWALDEDYTRLLLQHGTLAAHRRIEQVAEDVLQMQAPANAQRRVFAP